MLTFNKTWFVEVLLMVMVALTDTALLTLYTNIMVAITMYACIKSVGHMDKMMGHLDKDYGHRDNTTTGHLDKDYGSPG